MDRVVLGGCFLLVALGVLIGFGISAEQSIWTRIRAAMEFLSFAGTAITGVVAVLAFNNWRAQFRHAEKFKALKELRDASRGLSVFFSYLNAVVNRDMDLLSDRSQLDELAIAERMASQQWYAALDLYGKAWGVAVVFLTDEEANSFCGPAKIFYERTNEYVLKIRTSYSNSPRNEKFKVLLSTSAEVDDSAHDLCQKTMLEVEQLLARHAVA